MVENKYFTIMLDLARDAGKVALDFLERSSPALKKDFSVVTEADLRISALAHERLADLTRNEGHLLVDEEDGTRSEFLKDEILSSSRYLWSLDPVDGTRAYANQMPHYGISIGLLRDLRPWLGVVYFPSLGELFACDGQDAWFIRAAFTGREITRKIVPLDERISSRSVFIFTDELLGDFRWKSPDCRVMVLSAAVCEFCWPCIGRGCGSLSRVHLWDLAGSWPILEHAGLKLYSFSTGKVLDSIHSGLFEAGERAWKFKEHYVLASPHNFPLLRTRISFCRGEFAERCSDDP